MFQCFVCQLISNLDLTGVMVVNVLSHTCVLPNVESIFSAKSFSLGNLSFLNNFLKLSAG